MKDNFDIFCDKYKPLKNKYHSKRAFDGYLYETYGKEFHRVSHTENNNVWTLLQVDDMQGKRIALVPGIHYVNRLGYFVTKIPWSDSKEEYLL